MTIVGRMLSALTRLRRDERGATAIEYCLIAVAIGCAIAVTLVGTGSSLKTNFYDKIEQHTKN